MALRLNDFEAGNITWAIVTDWALVMDIVRLKIITYHAIKTTGTLIVIIFEL